MNIFQISVNDEEIIRICISFLWNFSNAEIDKNKKYVVDCVIYENTQSICHVFPTNENFTLNNLISYTITHFSELGKNLVLLSTPDGINVTMEYLNFTPNNKK